MECLRMLIKGSRKLKGSCWTILSGIQFHIESPQNQGLQTAMVENKMVIGDGPHSP